MDLWTNGATRGRGPPLFGSRVPHKLERTSRVIGRTPKGKLTIDGFMECLEWYVSERLPEHMGTDRIGKDHVRYHIFVATVPPTEKKIKPKPPPKTTTRNSSTNSTAKRPDLLRDMPPTEKKIKPQPTPKTTTRNSSTKSTAKRPDLLRDMLNEPRVYVAPRTQSRLVIPPYEKPNKNDPAHSTAQTTTDEKVS